MVGDNMKKNIILVLITAIIFTGVGAFANNLITAEQINYNENTTVKDKIDDLYTRQTDTIDAKDTQITNLQNQITQLNNESIWDKLALTPTFNYSIGYRTGPKTISLDVAKGNYIVVFTVGYALPASFESNIYNRIEETIYNSNCQNIIQKKLVNYNTTTKDDLYTESAVYKCEFSTNQTVSFSHSQSAGTSVSENFLIYAIKLN